MMLKSKKGFFGPQVRELIQDAKFEDQLSEEGKSSMQIIKKFPYHFFFDTVIDLVQSYNSIGVMCL